MVFMIPTEMLSREGSSRQWLQIATLVLASVFVTGCTNSKLIMGPLYNQLDNQIRSEFEKLGDFNATQTAAFEEAVGTFHVWHRQSEMPQYATLIDELAKSIARDGATSPDDIKRWSETAEKHSLLARQCYPANFLFGTVQTLTDEQINFIERRFKNERRKNREKYGEQTQQERIERRLKNIEKWAGCIGLDFTASQRATIRTSLTQQVSLRKEYYQLSEQWNRELFVLARDQEAANYSEQLTAHVEKLWTLLEREHPEQWQKNRDIWQASAFKLISSMSEQQRSGTSRWLAKMSKTVKAISKDKPSFQVGTDPAVGCLVDRSS